MLPSCCEDVYDHLVLMALEATHLLVYLPGEIGFIYL